MHADQRSEFQELLQDAIDGALAAEEMARLKAHLGECSQCSSHYDRLRMLDARLSRTFAETHALTAQFDRKVFERIAGIELERRRVAKHREQQLYAARLAELKRSWFAAARYHLGNLVGAVITIAVVFLTLRATPGFGSAQNSLLSDWLNGLTVMGWPATWAATTIGVAFGSTWLLRQLDRGR